MKYYNCPLEAAYMCKGHGVKFKDNDYNSLCVDVELNVQCEIYDIHEDSLPIFEPQVGDYVEIDAMYFRRKRGLCDFSIMKPVRVTGKAGVRYELTESGTCHDMWEEGGKPETPYKIIQRDGKQFFTPQEEV